MSEMAEETLLTVPQAAAALGVSQNAVRIAMTENRLPFSAMYGRKLVDPADLETYRKRSQPGGEKRVGRPRKHPADAIATDIRAGEGAE